MLYCLPVHKVHRSLVHRFGNFTTDKLEYRLKHLSLFPDIFNHLCDADDDSLGLVALYMAFAIFNLVFTWSKVLKIQEKHHCRATLWTVSQLSRCGYANHELRMNTCLSFPCYPLHLFHLNLFCDLLLADADH